MKDISEAFIFSVSRLFGIPVFISGSIIPVKIYSNLYLIVWVFSTEMNKEF